MFEASLEGQGIANLGILKVAGKFTLESGRSVKTGAVADGKFLDLPFCEVFYGLIKLLGAAETQVGAANHGVDIPAAGAGGNMFKGVDQTGMAAAQQDY